MVVRYQLFEFSLMAYIDRVDWPKSDPRVEEGFLTLFQEERT